MPAVRVRPNVAATTGSTSPTAPMIRPLPPTSSPRGHRRPGHHEVRRAASGCSPGSGGSAPPGGTRRTPSRRKASASTCQAATAGGRRRSLGRRPQRASRARRGAPPSEPAGTGTLDDARRAFAGMREHDADLEQPDVGLAPSRVVGQRSQQSGQEAAAEERPLPIERVGDAHRRAGQTDVLVARRPRRICRSILRRRRGRRARPWPGGATAAARSGRPAAARSACGAARSSSRTSGRPPR